MAGNDEGDSVTQGKNLPVQKRIQSRRKTGIWMTLDEHKLNKHGRIWLTMKQTKKQLDAHCGGSPSLPEQILIQRICMKTIRCFLYEMGVVSDLSSTPGSRDHYLALCNSLRLDLVAIGMKPKAGKVPSLESYIKENYGVPK